jgi:hypothetical protein
VSTEANPKRVEASHVAAAIRAAVSGQPGVPFDGDAAWTAVAEALRNYVAQELDRRLLE